MERTLSEINKTPGVIGSFVVASDGIIVASDFATELNDEMMGALTSSIINSTEKATRKMDQGDLVSFIVETDRNKLFFNGTRSGFLVCVASPEANLGLSALMYFATLTEVPILQGLLGSRMGQGPALTMLLAGPALSLPNLIVIGSVMGWKKTGTFAGLIVVLSTFAGLTYGAFVA